MSSLSLTSHTASSVSRDGKWLDTIERKRSQRVEKTQMSSTIGAHHALVAEDFCVSTLKSVECSEAACDRDMGCVPVERAALVQQLRCRG